ncbi:MAG: serine/threonine-protein kinase [Planctomycetota bacterium]|nr:serine/threonine-protein kinase [Planctomycetota bacterium]
MNQLTAEQWKQVEALFATTSELTQDEQAVYLKEHCDDDTVSAEVHSLLKARSRDRGQFETSVGQGSAVRRFGFAALRGGGDLTGQTIGRYTIHRVIAVGGMGTVYEAQQETPQRAVALKVINPGIATADLIRRFEQEAEVLGKLHHPGIAQIYDAGTFDLGAGQQPYFAMELIQGESLTNFAKKENLSTRQRVELMIRICEAVHHAHQRGVIHRDLKPANILIDELGQPKILDFGVARATDADLQTATLRTDIGQLIGTVPYMSPEQATGRPDELDTRSDVYALGVVLYELLVGRLPYDVKDKMIHEAVRIIKEDDPIPLSTINQGLRGDLETILSKALEKGKSRRYQSASEFKSDLGRYLNDEPIAARPPSTMYQLGKFAQRNKAIVSTIAAVLLMLLIGIVVTTAMAIEQTRLRDVAEEHRIEAENERDRARSAEAVAEERRNEAERQTRIATEVNQFLNQDLLGAADPYRSQNFNLTMREVLDTAALRIEGKFADEPLIEADIRMTIARTYQHLGVDPKAESHYQRAIELRRAELGQDAQPTLEARSGLGVLCWRFGRYEQAERIHKDVYEAYRKLHGLNHRNTVGQMNNIALVYWAQGRIEDAVELFEQSYELQLEISNEEDPDTLTIMQNLGNYYLDLARHEEAESILERTLETQRRVNGDDHPRTISTMTLLSKAYRQIGRHQESRDLAREAVDRAQRVLGNEHDTTLTSIGALAQAYKQIQQYDEAERLFQERLDLIRALVESHGMSPAKALMDFGAFYQALGRFQEAQPLLEEALQMYRTQLGVGHLYTLIVTTSLAELYMHLGLIDEAEPLFLDILNTRKDTLGEDDPQTLTAMANVGWVLWQRGKLQEAEPYFRQALETRRKVLPESHPHTLRVLGQYGNLLQLLKRYEEAEPLVKEAYESQEKLVGPTHSDTMVALSIYSLFFAEQGRFEEAELLARDVLERSRSAMPAEHWFIGIFLMRHGQCLARLNRSEEAESELLEAQRILNQSLGTRHQRTRQAVKALVAFFASTDRLEESARWEASLRESENEPDH